MYRNSSIVVVVSERQPQVLRRILWIIPVVLALGLLPACDADSERDTLATQTLTTTSPSQTTSPAPEPILFAITSPIDGSVFRTNVIKVEGTLPKDASAVAINGKPTHVSNGVFFAFVELAEGTNTIQSSAIINGASVTYETSVVFNPPLAVFITSLGPQDLDYQTTPMPVTGFVNKPQAAVTVNGVPVIVDATGRFSAQVQLSGSGGGIKVVAVLGNETNEHMAGIILFGGLGYNQPPGSSLFYAPRLIMPDSPIVKVRGESVVFEWKFESHKAIETPSSFNVSFFPVAAEYSKERIAPTPGLSIEFLPDSFTVYPETINSNGILVTTSRDVAPGVYYFDVQMTIDGGAHIGLTLRIEVR